MPAAASPALEAFIDETIRLSRQHGYHPTAFIGMRHRHRCRRWSCWNSRDVASGGLKVSVQAARSTG